MKNNQVLYLDIQLDIADVGQETMEFSKAMQGIHAIARSTAAAFSKMLNAKGLRDTFIELSNTILSTNQEMVELISLLEEQQATTQWQDELSVIGDICTIIQTLISLTDALVLAKIASKMEDIAIIALYVGDYVKAFGKMVALLAINTAAWAKNTAVKVADTAAQWAQIAATTAWKAICVIATAVTTAFGAAMTFLTSPIGLVVIGITALIAIIVLLIANWDTVKEWLIKGWEAIKNALSTAAEWFNNTIIQPIVGFFTNAMNWISTKVQEGFAFVQSIFMGVNEFLQNIFAKDWTEQFGAFGNVLNAFFANVENIWNAIKTVFSGIVTFVKSVFAGDWQAAWDGIIGIFSGIWEGIVAYVKVPINAIIGFINGLISGIVGGINLVIGALNHISVEIPDWDIFGSLAGKRFGFDFALLNAPQVPYLAKGAVLPANKPFLAMVGDQKHGTNVEAPLATIQEAVANVMVDMIPAMMAGFEAVVNEQRATRQAVESIELGDTVIGQAAARYSRKMAVIKGG